MKVTVTQIRRQTTVNLQATNFRARCSVCEREVEMLSAAETLGFLEIESGALENLVSAGKIHVAETVSGTLRFCKDSLVSK